MNDQHEAMEEEQVNVPFSSYDPNTVPVSFDSGHDVRFGSFSHATSSWEPTISTAPPIPYYQVPVEPNRNLQDLSIFERRGYLTGSLNVSCPDPMAMSTSQYQVPPTAFNAAMWSPNVSSGLGGMEGSVEYFSSPLGTGTLSFPGSTSASPVGAGWPANLTPMETGNMGSSGSLSVADNYATRLEDNNLYAEESFDTVLHMPGGEGDRQDVMYDGQSPGTGKAKAGAQPGPHEGLKASSGGRRNSSGVSGKSPSTSRKKERKRKTSSSHDSQPTVVQGPKLRTAARRHGSETGHVRKEDESPEDHRARTSHNKVEKEYRKRLNKEFELVIDVLPASHAAQGQSSRGKMSKADVIGNATMTIQSLADEVVQLREKKRLMEEKRKKLKNVEPS